MYKVRLKYADYNEVMREEDFYFNYSQAELVEMEYGTEGGLRNQIQKIIDSKDQPKIIMMFKKIVLTSYGIKSDDGKRFIKNDKVREEFSQTEAYSDLFMKLATDAQAAAEFINGIIPKAVETPTPAVTPAAVPELVK